MSRNRNESSAGSYIFLSSMCDVVGVGSIDRGLSDNHRSGVRDVWLVHLLEDIKHDGTAPAFRVQSVVGFGGSPNCPSSPSGGTSPVLTLTLGNPIKIMRTSIILKATPAATIHGQSLKPVPLALLPPIPLYRRLLRCHRKYLDREMRLLGDSYVKNEFRSHRNVENPLHIVRTG